MVWTGSCDTLKNYDPLFHNVRTPVYMSLLMATLPWWPLVSRAANLRLGKWTVRPLLVCLVAAMQLTTCRSPVLWAGLLTSPLILTVTKTRETLHLLSPLRAILVIDVLLERRAVTTLSITDTLEFP